MNVQMFLSHGSKVAPLCFAAALIFTSGQSRAETIEIGIGIQNTTTNTVTGGVVLKELGLLEKHLPKTGKYKDVTYSLSWQNATSGPPITNGMMANNIQIGMMGDYPLMVNGATGQATGNETQLVAIIAYNAQGSGNGIVVHKDSPYYDLADLKGKNVSVPFGSAAHGMMQRALEQKGLPPDFWNLVSQSPEIGSTNLQEKRIDAHADFVPFAELLPFRGFARKIYDGAETKTPTFHGVVVRKDFARKVSRDRRRLYRSADGSQRLAAQEPEARRPRRSRSGPRSTRRSSTSFWAPAEFTRSTPPSSRPGSMPSARTTRC